MRKINQKIVNVPSGNETGGIVKVVVFDRTILGPLKIYQIFSNECL